VSQPRFFAERPNTPKHKTLIRFQNPYPVKRTGGAFIGATLNRTPQSFALAIIGAEYLLGWLPRGTHDWNRFVRPSEFVLGLRRHGFTATRLAGLNYEWRRGEWAEADDLSVNYMVAALRR